MLELVRRRRLVERYALLWLITAIVLLVLAIWRSLLDMIAKATNIDSGPNAIFLAAFGLVFMLLLNFSVAISRLSEETKILAQEQARLDAEVRELRAARNGTDPRVEARPDRLSRRRGARHGRPASTPVGRHPSGRERPAAPR